MAGKSSYCASARCRRVVDRRDGGRARARFAATRRRRARAPFDHCLRGNGSWFVPAERPAGVRLELGRAPAVQWPTSTGRSRLRRILLDEFEETSGAVVQGAADVRAAATDSPLQGRGFMMSGGVRVIGQGTWGGACFTSRREFVSTVCMARRAQEGARLWRHLYDRLTPCDLYLPRTVDRPAARAGPRFYPAMLATCCAGMRDRRVWMKHQALHESSRRE